MSRTSKEIGGARQPAFRLPVPPGLILVAGMLLSATLVLTFGRDVFFTGDELSLISLVARIEPGELFEPYVGHLVPVSFLAYRLVLELFGAGEYAAFQALTLIAIFLMVTFLLLWGRARVPAEIAVAPCLLLLIFPQDFIHYFAGNGFVVVFSMACGLGALYAIERNSRLMDLFAFGLLVTGMMTYTVAVAFAVGALVATLLERDWKRLWVAGVPLFAYAVWRLTLASASTAVEDVGPDWSNLLLLPAWFFQATGDSAAALAGFGFDFARDGDGPTATDFLGPVLAVALLVVFILRFLQGRVGRGMIVAAATALALSASQVLVWGTFEARPGPGEARYLYPGALVVVMIGLELARGIQWNRRSGLAVWGITAASLVVAIGLVTESGSRTNVAGTIRAEILAIDLLQTTASPPSVKQQPRKGLRKSYDAVDGTKFGYLGFSEEEIVEEGAPWAPVTDRFLAESGNLGTKPAGPHIQTAGCRSYAGSSGSPRTRIELPPNGAILLADRPTSVRLGRYGSRASFRAGTVRPGEPAFLELEPDKGVVRWYLEADRASVGSINDLRVCRYRKATDPALSSPFRNGP